MKLVVVVVCMLAAGPAHADKLDTLLEALSGGSKIPDGVSPPQIVLGPIGGAAAGEPFDRSLPIEWTAKIVSKVVGYTADRRAAWVAADVKIERICIAQGCPDHDPHPSTYHETFVLDVPWQPVAWHIADTGTEKQALSNGPPPALARAIAPGAEDAAKLFESSIGDPKTLAATVSDRKDAVLYGSETPEKYVGGAKIKAMLAKWGLAFKVRDGVQAGLAASKSLAWVVATVDATPRKGGKAAPYRALAVYEKVADGWRLVALQFSVYVPTI